MHPKVSVVIGSHNARGSIRACLTALANQRHGQDAEILVVDNSTDDTAQIVHDQFPHVRLIRSPELTFIPELWERGITESRGDIIAMTTAHCVPQDNWLDEILKAHASPYAGISGAIENDAAAGLVDWAIYFCRYSPYMLPFAARTATDLPADNASYKRWALERCTDVRRHGFWEPSVHAVLRKEGLQLLLTPTIVVSHRKSFSALGFIQQRFWHGRQFGCARARQLSGLWRGVYILLSPLIPAVLLARIARQVLTKRRHIRVFVFSLPLLMVFLCSWSVGELTSYLWTAGKSASVDTS